jgi:hypothetical protein
MNVGPRQSLQAEDVQNAGRPLVVVDDCDLVVV